MMQLRLCQGHGPAEPFQYTNVEAMPLDLLMHCGESLSTYSVFKEGLMEQTIAKGHRLYKTS